MLAQRLPEPLVVRLSRHWLFLLGLGVVLFAFALEVAIAGRVPGVSNPEHVELVCWTALLAMFVALVLAFVGASAAETERSRSEPSTDGGRAAGSGSRNSR